MSKFEEELFVKCQECGLKIIIHRTHKNGLINSLSQIIDHSKKHEDPIGDLMILDFIRALIMNNTTATEIKIKQDSKGDEFNTEYIQYLIQKYHGKKITIHISEEF